MKIIHSRKGFTLIELLVSLSIFIVFLGIISQSYVAIVRAQRQANGVRRSYSEMRGVMEMLAQDVRLHTLDYDCYEKSEDLAKCPADIVNFLLTAEQEYLVLTNQERTSKVVYRFRPDLSTIQVKRYQKTNNSWEAFSLEDASNLSADGFQTLVSEGLRVKRLNFSVYPPKNPYSQAHYLENQYQFQPQVKVSMTVESLRENLPPFLIHLQTSFSSRVYSRK